MRVIITGGTGLIGRALAGELVAAGHPVVVLSRRPETVRGLPAGIEAVGWDGRTADDWGHLAEGAWAIVNLAGESLSRRWSAERKRRIRESRLNAGQAVVQAVEGARVRPRVVIQSSGIGYYGPRGDEELAEDAPVGDGWLPQLAVAWEASTAPVEAHGVRRAIVRSGVVLSVAGGALPRMMLPFRFFAGGPLGNGRQWLPWVHVADEARAIRFLLESESASGPYNLAAPNPLTNAQFSQRLGRAMHRPSWLPVPALALRLLLGEMASILLTGQRAVPRRLQEAGFSFRFPRLEQALEDLLAAPGPAPA